MTRQDFFFPRDVAGYWSVINESFKEGLEAQWNKRFSSYSLKDRQIYFYFDEDVCYTDSPLTDLDEWLKLIGDGLVYTISQEGRFTKIAFEGSFKAKQQFKQLLKKAAYCVACRHCEANCMCEGITFIDGRVKVNHCAHCGKCLVGEGCLRGKSLRYKTWNKINEDGESPS